MLPRRGYEPVDDVEDDATHEESATNGGGGGGRSALYSSIPTTAVSTSDRRREQGATSSSSSRGERTAGAAAAAAANDHASAAADEGGMTVRILDVKGETYTLVVRPETTVHELKTRLVAEAGVEIARQRIIYGGKLLVDSDTLASRKISTGAAIHLFQRPKSATPAGGAGVGTALAQQPGRLNEIPPLLLHVREAIDGGGGPTPAEGYLDTNWEVEVPRRSIRFLASSLLLLSAMQLLEVLGSVSAAMTAPEAGDGGDGHPALPSEYWDLVRARSFSSVMGIVVAVFGIRGSHSLSTQTIHIYFVGLVMCAAVAMVIRIGVLIDIITDKIPFGDYGSGSSDAYDAGGDDEGSSGDGGGAGREDEGGGPTPEEAQNAKFFTVFSSVVSLALTGVVWLLCIRRVGSMRAEIAAHVDGRERQLREMQQDPERQDAADSSVASVHLEEQEAAAAARISAARMSRLA
eukprot:jgi/Undpi1/3773/HiC_scaffold_16.g07142.m1